MSAAAPKRRGRPPGSKNKVPDPPKKRGRPRKNPIPDSPPKRPRGRPRKNPLPTTVKNTASVPNISAIPPTAAVKPLPNVSGEPKKRGRPRLHPLPSQDPPPLRGVYQKIPTQETPVYILPDVPPIPAKLPTLSDRVLKQMENQPPVIYSPPTAANPTRPMIIDYKAKADLLPHLYGWKWYRWARAFFDSTNKMNLLCAGNQLSKSSTQIRKCIDWATNQKKWERLWPARRPRLFWYLYPSKEVASIELETKWIPEFLPRDSMKDDPIYGYEIFYEKKKVISHIVFKSGVTVYFRSYSQQESNLQTVTLDAVFCDEELPEEKYDEIKSRLISTDGYFHMVFTATLNQDMWRRALEGRGDQELFPDALKMQVSLYDCTFYDDGTPSQWTDERIGRVVGGCKSQTEVQRRVLGRFVTDVGRKYSGFDASRHFMKAVPIPPSWRWYVGVDVGSGGAGKKSSHKAAIVFVAVRPDNRLGYVARGWRGDGEVTTSGDVFEKYRQLKGSLILTNQRYDPSAKDFGIIAARNSEGFELADRSHATGEDVINTLFQNDMLFIFDTDELRKLGSELSTLMKSTWKQNSRDDFCDAMRYCVATIPWDWTAIKGGFLDKEAIDDYPEEKHLSEVELIAEEIRRRRGEKEQSPLEDNWGALEDDIDEANEAYG